MAMARHPLAPFQGASTKKPAANHQLKHLAQVCKNAMGSVDTPAII